MFEFHKPFTVKDGNIYDRDGKYVKLWGVNYYTPFNHNYINLEEVGADHYRAIDRDIEHFKQIGVNFVRMHVYDREISDQDGHLVHNHRLKVMDYLLYRLEQEEIYLMMTPIVWFNSIELERNLNSNYAFWSINSCETFGFSNFYTAHEMIWNEDAIRAQETYLDEFFAHKNAYCGKRLDEFDNVAIIEVNNEAIYPTAERIESLRHTDTQNPYRLQEKKLVGMYEQYLLDTGASDCVDTEKKFCADLVLQYLIRTFSIVDRYFGNTIVKTHINYQFQNPYIMETLRKAPINAVSTGIYLPGHFDSAHNDHVNILPLLKDACEAYRPLKQLGKALIVYEYDMPSTLQGYYVAAFAQALASFGIQAAAFFTYTPLDIAEYNPGWLVHYFNMCHTPKKAVSFKAGEKIFRSIVGEKSYHTDTEVWKDEYYLISQQTDSIVWKDDTCLIAYGADALNEAGIREHMMGCGSISAVQRSGNGIWCMEKQEDDWVLTVYPSQKYVADPFRGKSFKFMANRYVNCNQENAVSRLQEKAERFVLQIGNIQSIKDEKGHPVIYENGGYLLYPGTYHITVAHE